MQLPGERRQARGAPAVPAHAVNQQLPGGTLGAAPLPQAGGRSNIFSLPCLVSLPEKKIEPRRGGR
jgi:hypothetical protein